LFPDGFQKFQPAGFLGTFEVGANVVAAGLGEVFPVLVSPLFT
jgi:hypothetical protein